MVKADDMSAEEAKARLKRLQEDTNQRQRDYSARMKSKGRRRVNAFIDAEATDILDREQDKSGRTVSEIVSEALKFWVSHSSRALTTTKQQPSVNTNVNTNVSAKYDQTETEKRIRELVKLGLGPAAISKRLEEEGISSPGGGPSWYRGTVARIITRLKENGLI